MSLETEFTIDDDERAWLHSVYQTLHANPELSMAEHQTAARIESELDQLGIEHFRCAPTGVVGLLRNGEGPVIALRADSDGLPILERTGLEYASSATGTAADGSPVPVMHGCGHDTHVACLLAALRVLSRTKHRWSGTVVAIFQPGEETGEGAKAMVADDLWQKVPHPAAVLAQHVYQGPAGTISMTMGPAMAAVDSLKVTVRGRQAHASRPHQGVDPIVLGAAMITRLQTITSRELNPHDSAVVTVGVFRGGMKENIIPDDAEFRINVRTLTEDVRAHVLAAISRMVRGEAEVAGAPEPEIEHYAHLPATVNDGEAAAGVFDALGAALGEDAVSVELPRMGSEDFGLLGHAAGVPSVLWFFGSADAEAVDPPGNHSPYFAPVLEPTLSTGAHAMVTAALHWLRA